MSDDGMSGFGEFRQAAFLSADFEDLAAILMQHYHRRCAISGDKFHDDRLEPTVFFLKPLDHGGVMAPSNAVLVERASARLLQSGIVQINDAYEAFVTRPDLLVSDDVEAIPAVRTLHLPDSMDFWPSRDMIAYHRSLFQAQ